MNTLDFYTKLYGYLYSRSILINKCLSPLRVIIRGAANYFIPQYLSNNKSFWVENNDPIIVSFTSFPARINKVWQVVECMFRQTIKPYKIFLWLSQEQFPTIDNVPNKLRLMQNDVFEIKFVRNDVRSHKKYLYVSREYPTSLVFLIDDDIYYPTDILEKSLIKYKEHPHSVICNYGTNITFDEFGRHLPYTKWKHLVNDNNVFFGSGGGTLFCPSKMYKDLTNEDLALSLTPTADDVWLNAMARLSNMQIYHSSNPLILPIINKGNIDLSSINNGQSQNDIQIKAIEDYYGRCFDRK